MGIFKKGFQFCLGLVNEGLDFCVGISMRLGGLDYLPVAVNAVCVSSADIATPARACTAFECKGSFIL